MIYLKFLTINMDDLISPPAKFIPGNSVKWIPLLVTLFTVLWLTWSFVNQKGLADEVIPTQDGIKY